jgi:hypothetical protein
MFNKLRQPWRIAACGSVAIAACAVHFGDISISETFYRLCGDEDGAANATPIAQLTLYAAILMMPMTQLIHRKAILATAIFILCASVLYYGGAAEQHDCYSSQGPTTQYASELIFVALAYIISVPILYLMLLHDLIDHAITTYLRIRDRSPSHPSR